ncbi:MAG: CDGSH iron-sulfur domain-containing protein [Candidatus Moranbacteria bacterium]|nr:CDGSH iron-sulfur domain-containing protein [Candidatus Moranbacteria bacterium]
MASTQKKKIRIMKDGPYLVEGNIPLAKEKITEDAKGYLLKWEKISDYPKQETHSLCRCGESKNAPFCDGAHKKASCNLTETADKTLFQSKAEKIEGEDIILFDAPELCASGHFCTRAGGIWDLVRAKPADPEKNEIAIQEACDCPSGRLVMVDKKTGREIEPEFEPSISVVEDEIAGVSGPIWVKGRIQIEGSDGTLYELRNRVTLCRCGESNNKPFCDGSHITVRFQDKQQ